MDDLFDAFEGDDNVELEEVENLEEEGQVRDSWNLYWVRETQS